MKREEILKEIQRLAQGRVNDAVRLAYLSEEELQQIGGLELSAVTEFKRSSNGTVELKFVDRLAALQWLSEQAEDPKGERLYEALERGAETQQDRGRGKTAGTVLTVSPFETEEPSSCLPDQERTTRTPADSRDGSPVL